jgi:virginiamycin B lyase
MMSNREHSPPLGEQDNDAEIPQPRTIAAFHTQQRTTHWSARRRRDVWFLLLVLLLGILTIFTLSNVGTQPAGRSHRAQQGASPAPTTTTHSTATSAITATGQFRTYPLPQSDSELMRPDIDHQGRVWFGEMGRNHLAVFDPRTQALQQMTPPQGHFGLMAVQVAPDDTIWFVEQYANYIGHYFPATGRYHLYPLPRFTVPDAGNPGKTLTLPSAPNELALDRQGTVWFTELNADRLGRLDPHTGRMQHYPLAAQKSVQTIDPYGVAVDPQGMIWFTEMGTGHIGRLDPNTGRMRFFTTPGLNLQPMEIASDTRGTIWVTSFSGNLLLRLDPRTGAFTPYYAPALGQGTGGLYGLVVAPPGDVWVTILYENVIARVDVSSNRFIYYHIPTAGSEPLGLAMDAHQALWFTGVDQIGMLRP